MGGILYGMPDLLLEVGCEELPASFVEKAYSDLADSIGSSLKEAGVLGETNVVFACGTPRRLIVSASGLLEKQPDSVKEMRGPSLKAAFDANGNPTNALLGFCRGQGVDVSTVRKDEQYVWVTKEIPGQDTVELLKELLPKTIRGLNFEKSMRWGSSRMRFARPIRWLLALFGTTVVEFDIEGVRSANTSRGHRFYNPDAFVVANYDELISGLRSRNVEPMASIRKESIQTQANKVASGVPVLTSSLVDENTFLTEWPVVIEGEFKEEFLALPESVLVTAMAKHEKMFPVRDAEGKLVNRFLFVRNSGEDASVRAGNAWVLNARFNDAKFFHDEDRKFSMSAFLDRTSGILFQEKLGTVRQRADRLSSVAAKIASLTGGDDLAVEFARQAGLYAKADLSTGLVSELASLQGIIGGEYAGREGFPEEVCFAISAQYDLSKCVESDSVAKQTAVRLVMADALDKLAGYLGIGIIPSGSSDPFGLRRAVTQLIEAGFAWASRLPDYLDLLDLAIAAYVEQGLELNTELIKSTTKDLFSARYSAVLPSVRYDILDASIETSTDPQLVQFRVTAITEAEEVESLVTAAKRTHNLLASASKKGFAFGASLDTIDRANLDSELGEKLYNLLSAGEKLSGFDVAASIRIASSIAPSVDAYIEGTMIMVDDEAKRTARLSLVSVADQIFKLVGRFDRLTQ